MTKLNSLKDLFIDEMRDLYNAEKQLTQALPKLAQASMDPDLQKAFTAHLEETKGHVERLEQIFNSLGESPSGKVCKAMQGLIEEGREMMEAANEPHVKDAGLIACAQRVEHYEMAGYGCVRTYAKLLGYDDAEQILQKTLDEEGKANDTLNKLATKGINKQAQEVASA